MLLEKFGFENKGEFANGECLYLKSKRALNKSTPYTHFPFINGNYDRFGILPIADAYHDVLFPYFEAQNGAKYDLDLAISNGVSKVYIATPGSAMSYKENEPVFIYRKFNGRSTGGKSAITSYCTITKIYYIKTNNKYLKTKDEYLEIIRNKSVYNPDELECIYKTKRNVVILELVYNGYLDKSNKIDEIYLKDNNFMSDKHLYKTILNKNQFTNLLKVGGENAKDIIID